MLHEKIFPFCFFGYANTMAFLVRFTPNERWTDKLTAGSREAKTQKDSTQESMYVCSRSPWQRFLSSAFVYV